MHNTDTRSAPSAAERRYGSSSSPPIRIFVIAPQPFYEDRGTPIAVRHVLEALSEQGYAVDLLTYPIGETLALPGLRTFRSKTLFGITNVRIGFSIRKLLLDLRLTRAFWRQLRRERYDCIHAVEEAAFPAVAFRRWHKIPVIYDMQSSLPEQLMDYPVFRATVIQGLLRLFERWLIRHVDHIACSTGLENYVHGVDPSARVMEWRFPSQHVDVSAEQLRQLRTTLEIEPQSRVVLYCGNMAGYQGVAKIVDGAARVLSAVPNAVFVLVGAHDPADFALSASATELLRRGKVKLIRRQPRSEIPQYLALADIVVSPRDGTTNLPLKIFDYMAAGKAIVAADSPSYRTVLNEERAVFVQQTSVEEWANAIGALLCDEKKAARLGAAARAYAEENLGWKAFVESVSQLYARAQGTGRRSRNRA